MKTNTKSTYRVNLLYTNKAYHHWGDWFEYKTEKAAREVSDHFNGIKRLKDYSVGPYAPFKKARVVKVTIITEII